MKWGERRRRRRQAVSSAEVIARVIDGYDIGGELRAHRLICEWPEIVGDRIGARTVPDGLEGSLLWVRVASSAWMQELSFIKPQLLEAIDKHLGAPTLVTELRFHLGKKAQHATDKLAGVSRPPLRPVEPRRAPLVVPEETRSQIEEEVATVQDEDIRAAVKAARLRWGL